MSTLLGRIRTAAAALALAFTLGGSGCRAPPSLVDMIHEPRHSTNIWISRSASLTETVHRGDLPAGAESASEIPTEFQSEPILQLSYRIQTAQIVQPTIEAPMILTPKKTPFPDFYSAQQTALYAPAIYNGEITFLIPMPYIPLGHQFRGDEPIELTTGHLESFAHAGLVNFSYASGWAGELGRKGLELYDVGRLIRNAYRKWISLRWSGSDVPVGELSEQHLRNQRISGGIRSEWTFADGLDARLSLRPEFENLLDLKVRGITAVGKVDWSRTTPGARWDAYVRTEVSFQQGSLDVGDLGDALGQRQNYEVVVAAGIRVKY